MTPAFNLLDEPWIPVRTHSGEVFDINLSDALLKARDYASLAETSPPNLIALYRLLLAMLHRALTTHHGKWSDKDRARWFREGLPEEPIRAYLTEWRERFWLFHPTEPFMQVAALAEAEETRDVGSMRPWTQLTLDCTSGNAPVVFDHSIDSRPDSIDAAVALRHLLGFLQFVPGGMVRRFRFRDESGPLDNVAAVLPVGDSLLQTLCLSLNGYSRNDAEDLPSWEAATISAAKLREHKSTLPTGEADLFTRLTRAVLLDHEADETGWVVRRVRFGAGLTLTTHDHHATDPMAAYRKRSDDKLVPITFQDGRSVWRDLPAMLPDGEGVFHQPAALSRALNCLQCFDANAGLSFVIAGTASDPVQCKVFRWRAERLELPSMLFTHPDAPRFLRSQVQLAEEVYAGVRKVLSDLIALTMPDPKHKDTRSRARDMLTNGPAASVFFSTAERALPELMRQIAGGEIDAADRDWKAMLIEAANRAWTATRQSLGDSPAVLRADARTWPRFRSVLKTLIPLAAQAASTTEEVAA